MTPPAARFHPVPVLVGLFAAWQLAFVPLANTFEFVPQRQTAADVNPPVDSAQRWGRFTDNESVQTAAEVAGYALASWAEATGQDQGWVMFTPGFPANTVYPVVEFRFPDGAADRVPSPFAPDPANPSPRLPLRHDRMFNYEANVFMLAWHADPAAVAADPELGRQLPDIVRANDTLLTRYLDWHARRYRAVHPERPLAEVVLLLRFIPTPDPGEPRDPARHLPVEQPFARWLPGGPAEPGFLPLEGYDAAAGRFVRLRPWGKP